MQAEWMRLKIHVLLSHGGVFDFKPVFSWSLYFIKSIAVHYGLANVGKKKKVCIKATHITGVSKTLIGIVVYTFTNKQINATPRDAVAVKDNIQHFSSKLDRLNFSKPASSNQIALFQPSFWTLWPYSRPIRSFHITGCRPMTYQNEGRS